MDFDVVTSIPDKEDPPFVGPLELDDEDLNPPTWLFYASIVTSVGLILVTLSWCSVLLRDTP